MIPAEVPEFMERTDFIPFVRRIRNSVGQEKYLQLEPEMRMMSSKGNSNQMVCNQRTNCIGNGQREIAPEADPY